MEPPKPNEDRPPPFSPFTWEVPKSSLTKRITRQKIDSIAYNDPDWIAFVDFIGPDDELWEYRHLEVSLGLATGSGGFAVVRNGGVVAGYPTEAYG